MCETLLTRVLKSRLIGQSRIQRPVVFTLVLAAAMLTAQAALGAVILQKASRSSARPGATVRVTAGGYLGDRPWPAMPVVFVRVDQAPHPAACENPFACPAMVEPSALHRAPYVFLGRIRHWRLRGIDAATGDLTFRVPAVKPGVYQLLLFCDRCVTGTSGSLINVKKLLLTVR
jgi:hypothetical protein